MTEVSIIKDLAPAVAGLFVLVLLVKAFLDYLGKREIAGREERQQAMQALVDVSTRHAEATGKALEGNTEVLRDVSVAISKIEGYLQKLSGNGKPAER